MAEFDRLRILWIDDRQVIDGLPEPALPTELQQYFEVAHPKSSPESIHSYASAEEFMDEFIKLWRAHPDHPCDYLPAEIVAIDYHLEKKHGAVGGSLGDDVPSLFPKGNTPSQVREERPTLSTSSNATDWNYDGLQIATFYATLTHAHPAALVSITNYMAEMPSGVETLHALAKPVLGLDDKVLNSTNRSWQNIITTGLDQLRRRIQYLYENGDILISPSDLMALCKGENDILTIKTPYSMRRLPISGLFYDIASDGRQKAIEEWAYGAIESLVDGRVFNEAKSLADELWDYHKNDVKLVAQREQLSELHLMVSEGGEPSKEYNDLCGIFGVKRYRGSDKKCTLNIAHIMAGSYEDDVRRLACILIIYYCVREYVLERKCSGNVYSEELSSDVENMAQDIYYTLYPLPETPITFPADRGKRVSTQSGWGKALTRLAIDTNENESKSVGIKILDALNGRGWNTDEGVMGLEEGERRILQGMIIEDFELSEKDWKKIPLARRVLWGANSF